MKMLEEAHATEIKELKREITSLENKLSVEKAAIEAEKRKNNALFEQHHNIDDEQRYSPSLDMMERESVDSSNSILPAVGTNAISRLVFLYLRFLVNEFNFFFFQLNDSIFETSSGRFPPNVYDSFRSGTTNSTSMIENLQAQLKQRDGKRSNLCSIEFESSWLINVIVKPTFTGEVHQLQWELSRRNTERDALNTEVSLLASKVEDLNSSLADLETIKGSLNDIQTKYDALLQMYGEKVEENQELQLDLVDVKEMYKTQIDHLLQRDR